LIGQGLPPCLSSEFPQEWVGAEALLRWKSKDLGMVSPAKFIPILEETGLINEVGDLVLSKVCYFLKARADMSISVNISPIQFMDKSFVERISSIVKDLGVCPQNITLEITENVFVRDEQQALRILSELKGIGFKLAVDDFGTGYSSLNYLRMFPLDLVKIDISYIRDIPHDSKDRAIVKSIIDMAHALGMGVVAEGVEEKVQLDILRELGCDMYQGFLFYRPMRPEEFPAHG
jgi:EAL domain-containing protein (putative c-di-GMP-specific phosphodiesterase class I)